jgi:hypothetical protein
MGAVSVGRASVLWVSSVAPSGTLLTMLAPKRPLLLITGKRWIWVLRCNAIVGDDLLVGGRAIAGIGSVFVYCFVSVAEN